MNFVRPVSKSLYILSCLNHSSLHICKTEMFIVTSSTQSLYLSLREKWVEYQDICCEVVSSSDWEAVCKHPQQHGCLDKIDPTSRQRTEASWEMSSIKDKKEQVKSFLGLSCCSHHVSFRSAIFPGNDFHPGGARGSGSSPGTWTKVDKGTLHSQSCPAWPNLTLIQQAASTRPPAPGQRETRLSDEICSFRRPALFSPLSLWSSRCL